MSDTPKCDICDEAATKTINEGRPIAQLVCEECWDGFFTCSECGIEYDLDSVSFDDGHTCEYCAK